MYVHPGWITIGCTVKVGLIEGLVLNGPNCISVLLAGSSCHVCGGYGRAWGGTVA